MSRVSEERPLASDTSLAAERAQFATLRRLSPAAKFAAFLDLQQTAILLAESGIRLRHPEASEREIFCAVSPAPSMLRRCGGSTAGSPTPTDEHDRKPSSPFPELSPVTSAG